MRIFGMELKKLLNWRLLLVLVLFSGLYYWMFLDFDLVVMYTKNHPQCEYIQVGTYLLQKYGATVDETEQKDFEKTYFQQSKQPINAQILQMKEFRDAGIKSVDQLEALDNDKKTRQLYNTLYEKLNDAFGTGTTGKKSGEFYLYQTARDTVSAFQHYPQYIADARAKGEPAAKLNAKAASVFPNWPIFDSWMDLAQFFCLLLLATVAVLLSPYLVQDGRSGVRSLAYTCKKGRALFGTQFAASCAAALLAVLVQAGVLLARCLNGPRKADVPFFGCDITGWTQYPYWSGVTFGRLVAMCFFTMFLLAAAFAFVSFAVSAFCKNYVAVLAVQVPLLFLGSELGRWVFRWLLPVWEINFGKTALCAAFALLTLGFCLWLVRREKRRDVLA